MDPDEGDFCEEDLYSAEDAERLPCFARAIIYCPTVIGGLIALRVKLHANASLVRREILMDIPSLKLISQAPLFAHSAPWGPAPARRFAPRALAAAPRTMISAQVSAEISDYHRGAPVS